MNTWIDRMQEKRLLVIFILASTALYGLYTFLTMSRLEDPEVTVKQALIVTPYPGADTQQVERELTEPLERAIRTMGDLEHVPSRSRANVSVIKVTLKATVPSRAIDQYWDLLRRRVSDAARHLPEGTHSPIVMDDFGDVYGLFYALSATSLDHEGLLRSAEWLQTELQNIPGVKAIKLFGQQTPTLEVLVDRSRLAHLGIHPLQILTTLRSQNKAVYAGALEDRDTRLLWRIGDEFKSPDDLRNLLISTPQGRQIPLGELATIHRALEPNPQTLFFHNQKPALALALAMEPGTNIVASGKLIARRLGELEKRLPEGLSLDPVFFQPEKVESAISQFVINLIESVLIVIAILMVTMGLRSGLLIGGSLVLIILITTGFLNALGGTLQRVSLGAFIVAMGMLVDNAIVVVDGMLVDRSRGMSLREARTSSARRTALPLLGATLMAIAAFLPIFLSPDTTGEYTRDLFLVLAISLGISWLLAMVQIPLSAHRLLRQPVSQKDQKNWLDTLFSPLFRLAFNHRRGTLVATILLLFGSLLAFPLIRQSFFPDLTYNQCYVEVQFPAHTPIARVGEELRAMSAHLLKQPGVTAVTASAGATPARYCLVRTMADPDPTYGELIVSFTDFETQKALFLRLEHELKAHFPLGRIRFKAYNLIVENTHTVEILFSGPDPRVLRELGHKAMSLLDQTGKTRNLSLDWPEEIPELLLNFDQNRARQSGLNRAEVGTSLLLNGEGFPLGMYREGNRLLPILLRIPEQQRETGLRDLPLWKLTDGQIPLGLLLKGRLSLTDWLSSQVNGIPLSRISAGETLQWTNPEIRRFNGQRALTVHCDPAPGVTAPQIKSLVEGPLKQIDLPIGYQVSWRGEYESSHKAMKYIVAFLPLAGLLMLACLLALFPEWKSNLAILLCTPLALIGVIWGLIISGKELGFVAIVGAIGLIGMMLKNGVVLVDEIQTCIRSGQDPAGAVRGAAQSRVRPVMMASLTTILGMLPLISDPMFGALSVAIMAGLLVGTLTTLIILPLVYALLYRIPLNLSQENPSCA